MSGQAYHKGTVLITCPGCKNRHVISDHLMIFSEQGRSLEDILKEKGETITKATASSEADLEFLDDGSVKARVPKQLEGLTPMVPGETGWPKGLTEEEVKKVRGDQ
ncbi:MAG: phospholipase C type enzyme [Watsoniomyces obsoletus]|nr:MAG: phospholipase C type enzyme [Watsoniomyces obsoletus]